MRLTLVAEIATHLDHPPDDELATLGAAWREEDVEVVLAIFPPLELVEDPVGEGAEALGADEARGVEELAVRVDNLGFGLKAIVTTRAGDALQVHDARHPVEEVGALALGHWGGEDKQLSGSVLGRHCCCCPDVLPSAVWWWARHAYLARLARNSSPAASSSSLRTGISVTGQAGTGPSMGPGHL